jgi:hypothetical protein
MQNREFLHNLSRFLDDKGNLTPKAVGALRSDFINYVFAKHDISYELEINAFIKHYAIYKDLDILQKIQKSTEGFIIQEIINEVCKTFDVGEHMLYQKTRKRNVVMPRFFAIYFIKMFTTLTLTKIGTIFNRDHSTIISAINTIDDLLSYDKEIQNTYNKMLGTIKLKKQIIHGQQENNRCSTTFKLASSC